MAPSRARELADEPSRRQQHGIRGAPSHEPRDPGGVGADVDAVQAERRSPAQRASSRRSRGRSSASSIAGRNQATPTAIVAVQHIPASGGAARRRERAGDEQRRRARATPRSTTTAAESSRRRGLPRGRRARGATPSAQGGRPSRRRSPAPRHSARRLPFRLELLGVNLNSSPRRKGDTFRVARRYLKGSGYEAWRNHDRESRRSAGKRTSCGPWRGHHWLSEVFPSGAKRGFHEIFDRFVAGTSLARRGWPQGGITNDNG